MEKVEVTPPSSSYCCIVCCTTHPICLRNAVRHPEILTFHFNPAGEVSEAALVRDILYVFQGIDGKFIKMSAQDNCYKIDSKVPEPASFNKTHQVTYFTQQDDSAVHVIFIPQ